MSTPADASYSLSLESRQMIGCVGCVGGECFEGVLFSFDDEGTARGKHVLRVACDKGRAARGSRSRGTSPAFSLSESLSIVMIVTLRAFLLEAAGFGVVAGCVVLGGLVLQVYDTTGQNSATCLRFLLTSICLLTGTAMQPEQHDHRQRRRSHPNAVLPACVRHWSGFHRCAA